jgi:hypothetical protein
MSSRDKILARRARFMAAAMTGMGVIGCASKSEACLSAVYDAGPDALKDSTATDGADTEPQACLSAPFDSGSADAMDSSMDSTTTDTATPTDTGVDTGPMPCLAPPPGDSG